MWLPDLRRSPRYLLRLGQASVQLWRFTGQGWVQLESQPAHQLAHDQYSALSELVQGITQALPQDARVQVLADSKWMPLSLLATGSKPLAKSQVDVLAKHRFAQTFGDHANAWNIQTAYVAGDAHALAFACPIGLLSSLRQGIESTQADGGGKHRLIGLAPTLAWAWDQVWRSATRQHSAWLVLAEQDRSILVRARKGQAGGLQPAGPLLHNPEQLNKVIRTEALRCGVLEEAASVLGFSFEASPAMVAKPSSDGLDWRVFGSEGATQ